MTRFLTVFSLLLTLPAAAEAATARLDVGQGQAFTTIASAIAVAKDGDIIVVHGGTYREQIVVDNPAIAHLTIQAYPGDSVLIDVPDDKVNAIIAQTVNLRLKGLTIEAPNHASPQPRGLNDMTYTPTTSSVFDLLMCDVTVRMPSGVSIDGSTGILCAPDSNDTLKVHGYNVTISGFAIPMSPTCSFGGGWDDEPTCSAL